MSIATEISRLQTAKADIETAIEAKGVTVPALTSLSDFDTYIAQIETGGGGWTPHPDWIDISTVADNEIKLLVSDATAGVCFRVESTGTFSIDWGDGTTITGQTTGDFQRQYTVGSGTACSLGYTTFAIRIFNASADITHWRVAYHNFHKGAQSSPILWANFGTTGLVKLNTDANNRMFNNVTTNQFVYCRLVQKITIPTSTNLTGFVTAESAFTNCSSLQSVTLPTSCGGLTNTSGMFTSCTSLQSVTLPTSWGSITTTAGMFNNCTSLQSVTLPTSWGSITNTASMFSSCYSLQSVTLPTSWGSITTTASMFYSCYSLQSVTLPTSWGSITNTASMFSSCYSLQSVTLPTSWGSITNTSSMFISCTSLQSVTLPTTMSDNSVLTNMFNACNSLKTINNTQYLGSLTTQSNFFNAFVNSNSLLSVSINSLLSAITVGVSAAANQTGTTSIRLTNSGSTFTGSSPQVDVQYCSLDATALNTLFGDLPTLTGKTIRITGNPGSATCDTTIATAKGWTVTN